MFIQQTFGKFLFSVEKVRDILNVFVLLKDSCVFLKSKRATEECIGVLKNISLTDMFPENSEHLFVGLKIKYT